MLSIKFDEFENHKQTCINQNNQDKEHFYHPENTPQAPLQSVSS